MRISVEADIKGAVAKLNAVRSTQIPFAASLAINALAKDAQVEIRQGMASAFTLRRKDFLEKQGAKIVQFAKKSALQAVIGTDPKASFLGKFTRGGDRPHGGLSIAIPVDVRRNKSDVVTKANRPRALLASTKNNGVYIKRDASGRGEILKRVGRGKQARTQLLYLLVPRARVPRSLPYEEIVARAVRGAFATRWAEAWARAQATAR